MTRSNRVVEFAQDFRVEEVLHDDAIVEEQSHELNAVFRQRLRHQRIEFP